MQTPDFFHQIYIQLFINVFHILLKDEKKFQIAVNIQNL